MTPSPDPGPDGATPLARLLAMAFRDLVDGLHARLAERGWPDVRPAYGFVLVAARDRTTSATEVAGLLGTTKQAAAKLVEQMLDAGYLERLDAGPDRRVVRLGLTARGRALLADVEQVYADLEGEWAAVIGGEAVERMRGNLDHVLRARHGGGLPAVRPTW